MIIISNKQRDDVVRFLGLLCETLQGSDTNTFNTRRLARKLAGTLAAKHPLSASELSAALKILAQDK